MMFAVLLIALTLTAYGVAQDLVQFNAKGEGAITAAEAAAIGAAMPRSSSTGTPAPAQGVTLALTGIMTGDQVGTGAHFTQTLNFGNGLGDSGQGEVCGLASGTTTIKSGDGSILILKESGVGCTENGGLVIHFNYSFSAEGGTGRFAHTTGTGSVVTELHPENGAGPVNYDVLVSIHGHLDM